MLHPLNFKKSTKFTPRAYDFLSHFFSFVNQVFTVPGMGSRVSTS